MSKIRVVLPLALAEIRAMLPEQSKLESVKLVDVDKDGGVEIVYDDPSVKSPYTFPKDVPFREFVEQGRARADERRAKKEAQDAEAARLQAKAEAQLRAEEEAKAKAEAEASQPPAAEPTPAPTEPPVTEPSPEPSAPTGEPAGENEPPENPPAKTNRRRTRRQTSRRTASASNRVDTH